MPFFSTKLLLAAAACSQADAAPVLLELDDQQTGLPGTLPVWSAKLRIGSNPEPHQLLVDTGSSVLVVSSMADVRGGRVGGKASLLSTDDDQGKLTIEYAGGSVSGSVVNNKVCFAGTENGEEGPCMDPFPMFFADTTDSAFAQLGLDGVLGMAPQPGKAKYNNDALDETVADGFSKSGLARSFSLFVSPNADVFGTSELALGGANMKKVASGEDFTYVDLAQPLSGRWELGLVDLAFVPAGGKTVSLSPCANATDGCRVLIDSGTAGLEAHPSLQDAWQSKMPVQLADDCSNVKQMPDMQITFQGGATLRMGPSVYLRSGEMGCGSTVDTMTDRQLQKHPSTMLILGEPFLRRFYTMFDQDNSRIGFALSIAAPRAASDGGNSDGDGAAPSNVALTGFLSAPSLP